MAARPFASGPGMHHSLPRYFSRTLAAGCALPLTGALAWLPGYGATASTHRQVLRNPVSSNPQHPA
jgi:hypothetical protein